MTYDLSKISNVATRVRFSVLFSASMMLVGFLQWAHARLSPASLSPKTWGDLATAIPMEFWAIANVTGATMVFLGLLNPPKRWMTVTGCVVQLTHFHALAHSALFTGGDIVIAAFVWALLTPLHVVLIVRAFEHDR